MGRYPHLVLHRRRWMVRLIVPADVRPLIGQSVFKISTGETDEHRAVGKAGPIIAGLKERIRTARATLRTPVETQAEELAAAYQARHTADPVIRSGVRADRCDRVRAAPAGPLLGRLWSSSARGRL